MKSKTPSSAAFTNVQLFRRIAPATVLAVVREGLAEVVVGSHGRVLRGYGTLLPSSPPYEQPIHKSTHSPFDRRLTQVLQSSRSWPCAQQRAWGQRTVAALRRFLERGAMERKGGVSRAPSSARGQLRAGAPKAFVPKLPSLPNHQTILCLTILREGAYEQQRAPRRALITAPFTLTPLSLPKNPEDPLHCSGPYCALLWRCFPIRPRILTDSRC